MSVRPTKPIIGMRVTYGRTGNSRTGWKGTITKVCCHTYGFLVDWDECREPTHYQRAAWANSPYRDSPRNRDVHYIFFDERHESNAVNFPTIFNCAVSLRHSDKRHAVSKPTTPPALPTELKKDTAENVMNPNKEAIVEELTLVDGTDITQYSVKGLIDKIAELEGRIDKLKAIKVESKKIKSMIKECRKAIVTVVTELDKR